jgi:hypothetical protein
MLADGGLLELFAVVQITGNNWSIRCSNCQALARFETYARVFVHVGPFPVFRRQSLHMFEKKTSFEVLVSSRTIIAISVSILIYP